MTPFDEDWYLNRVKYAGADNVTLARIASVLAKLPEDAAQWAVEAIAFLSVGGEISGHTLSLSGWGEELRHVIALDEVSMGTRNGSYVVAHEIAHARLGHAAFANPSEGTEEAADQLAAEWGFKRA